MLTIIHVIIVLVPMKLYCCSKLFSWNKVQFPVPFYDLVTPFSFLRYVSDIHKWRRMADLRGHGHSTCEIFLPYNNSYYVYTLADLIKVRRTFIYLGIFSVLDALIRYRTFNYFLDLSFQDIYNIPGRLLILWKPI